MTPIKLYNKQHDSYCTWNGVAYENDGKVPGAYFYGIEKAKNNGFEPIISLEQYSEMVGCKENFKTLQEIQDYVEEVHDVTLWDYPLEEENYCKEEDRNVVLVETDFGLRLCEI